jgi:hypothetical protein
MLLMITLYCLIAAILVVGLSLRAEYSEMKARKRPRKSPAQVISIDSARPRLGNLHKHA